MDDRWIGKTQTDKSPTAEKESETNQFTQQSY